MRLTSHPRASGLRALLDTHRLGARWSAVLIAIALLTVFLLDRATGSSPVQHLYYVPIIFAAVRFGMRGGTFVALAAIVLYHVANPHLMAFRYEQWDLLQIAVLLAAGIITARVADDARRLRLMAMTDDLTGLHNLRSFEQHLNAMVRASRHNGGTLALFVLDVDRLKGLNDVHGHLVGAEAVRTVGRVIAEWSPAEAVACRYGGDEFVIAVPRCTVSRARILADGLRHDVNREAPTLAGISFDRGALSVSIGVACREFTPHVVRGTDAEAGEALFRLADAALYRAKHGGRNHVCVA
jgi:diguanylate cyclase (GGDEF)-like protein